MDEDESFTPDADATPNVPIIDLREIEVYAEVRDKHDDVEED